MVFNCAYLLIANCEFYPCSQLIDLQTKRERILQYGMGSKIAIIGFTIWPDLTSTQLLNHAIKTRPTVYIFLRAFSRENYCCLHFHWHRFLHYLCIYVSRVGGRPALVDLSSPSTRILSHPHFLSMFKCCTKHRVPLYTWYSFIPAWAVIDKRNVNY